MKVTLQVKPYELIPRLWIGGAPVADDAGMHVDLLVMLAHEYDPGMTRGLGGLVRYLPCGTTTRPRTRRSAAPSATWCGWSPAASGAGTWPP